MKNFINFILLFVLTEFELSVFLPLLTKLRQKLKDFDKMWKVLQVTLATQQANELNLSFGSVTFSEIKKPILKKLNFVKYWEKNYFKIYM